MTDSQELSIRRRTGLPQSALQLLRRAWNPVPVAPPAADPELPDYPFLVRSAEALKYQMLRIEYSLSRGGGIRAWLKMNLIFSLLLVIPAVLTAPLITLLLSGISSWAFFIYQTVKYAALAVIWGIVLTVIVVTAAFVTGQSRRGRTGKRK